MLKTIAGVVGALVIFWGGAYITSQIPRHHWTGGPAFFTLYMAFCGCMVYAAVHGTREYTRRKRLRDWETEALSAEDCDTETFGSQRQPESLRKLGP